MANTEIYISKGGQPPESPCSFEEAQQLLSTGAVSEEDLAWCEGLAEWYPVPAVVEYVQQQTAPPVPLFQSLLAEIGGTEAPIETPVDHKGTGARLDRTNEKKTTLLGRLGFKRKKRVTEFELGHELWASCKKWSREFFTSLNNRIAEMGYTLNEESEFVLLEEILVAHLWLISRAMASSPAAVEVLHRNFLSAHLRVAGSFGSEEEQTTYVNSVEASMMKRFGLYEKLWDKHTPQIQTVLVSFMLKQMFKSDDPHPAPRDPHLLGSAHTYVLDRFRLLQEERDQYEIVG